MIYELTTDYLKKNFSPKDDLSFSEKHGKELVQKIYAKAHNQTIDYKEEVRDAFKDFLGKVGRVSVFFRGKDRIAVKVLPKEQAQELSKEEVKASVVKESELAFIKETVHNICETELNFTEINNRIWESTYLAHVKSGFYKAVLAKAHGNQALASEISLEIIRDNFAYLNDSLAEELLERMLVSKKAESFLEYYGKTMVADGGIRFKTPDIIDRKGRLWHISTIRPVVTKFHKENKKALGMKHLVESLIKKLDTMQNDLTHLRESKESVETEKVESILAYSESGTKLTNLRKDLGKLRKDLANTNQEHKKALLEEEVKKKIEAVEQAKLADNQSRVRKITAQNRSKERYEKENRLKKKIEGVRIQLRSEESYLEKQHKNFSGTQEAYDYIVDAVANALMRKKRVLG